MAIAPRGAALTRRTPRAARHCSTILVESEPQERKPQLLINRIDQFGATQRQKKLGGTKINNLKSRVEMGEGDVVATLDGTVHGQILPGGHRAKTVPYARRRTRADPRHPLSCSRMAARRHKSKRVGLGLLNELSFWKLWCSGVGRACRLLAQRASPPSALGARAPRIYTVTVRHWKSSISRCSKACAGDQGI
jgi:hypothetical protein